MSDPIETLYRRFAEREARGHSPLYEALALGVAGDAELCALLSGLPPEKRQPNLLFAATRLVAGTPGDFAAFRASLLDRRDAILAVMRTHRTQTNEPARCAVLLPVLARLHPPLALIEVGASAGLCLIPDKYAYDYDGVRLGSAAAPVFACRTTGGTPIPTSLPQISWRLGLDLEPVRLWEGDQRAWLEALIWPDQPDRLARFRAAVEVAREHPVRLRRGDLTRDLDAALAEAPTGCSVVVFHSAVLAYVADAAEREAFAERLWARGVIWVSNEAPFVFPAIAARAPRPGPPGAFLLSVNGQPAAWTDPHGAWIDWMI